MTVESRVPNRAALGAALGQNRPALPQRPCTRLPAAFQANRIRALSKSNLARPYICRFNSLTRVTWPST